MKRTAVAVGLATVAVGVLAFIALESRPIPARVHIAQNSLSTELGLVAQDYAAIVATLDSAWRANLAPGDAASELTSRIRTSPERLADAVAAIPGNGNQRNRITNSFEAFTEAAANTTRIADELVANVAAYGASVTILRELGPQTVQRLRDLRLDRAATDTFRLVMGSLEFASDGVTRQAQELQRLLTTLERDQRIDANMPREMASLRTAVSTVLDGRSAIENRIEELESSSIVSSAQNLATAVNDSYRSNVARIDRARMMLAGYAMMLLAAVAFIGWRLKESYSDVADANADLSALNESLETRVTERTRELEGTLADLKESQVQLVQAEKMSSLGQLVAGISHEINTPLLYLANNVVLIRERLEHLQGFLQRSLSAYGMHPDDFAERSDYQKAFAAALNELKHALQKNELDADLAEALDLLEDCGDGLEDLTEMAQSLKDFSRLDRAPVGNFDVNSGLEKTLVIARNMIKHKANISKHYGDVPDIECSPSKINQVFLNLITNAAQAIDGTGEIVLRTERYGDDRIAISVSDTGCGIPESIIDKIRDPFFTTKDVGKGTGLGLSIVDEIIRSHGGELLIESEVGKGSKFTVVLPIKAPPAPPAELSHEEPATTAYDTSSEAQQLAEAS
jgi:signal transduction histidine kinase